MAARNIVATNAFYMARTTRTLSTSLHHLQLQRDTRYLGVGAHAASYHLLTAFAAAA